MNDWELEDYEEDRTVNAILNLASAVNRLAVAHERFFYAFKYGHEQGMSVAEAIEVGLAGVPVGGVSGTSVSDGLESIASAVREAEEAR